MNLITNAADVRRAIRELEEERVQEWARLKTQLALTQESLKPSNMIKAAVLDLVATSEAKSPETDTTLGIAAGYMAKKAVNGIARSSFVKVVQTLLEVVVSRKLAEKKTIESGSIAGVIEKLFAGNNKTSGE